MAKPWGEGGTSRLESPSKYNLSVVLLSVAQTVWISVRVCCLNGKWVRCAFIFYNHIVDFFTISFDWIQLVLLWRVILNVHKLVHWPILLVCLVTIVLQIFQRALLEERVSIQGEANLWMAYPIQFRVRYWTIMNLER